MKSGTCNWGGPLLPGEVAGVCTPHNNFRPGCQKQEGAGWGGGLSAFCYPSCGCFVHVYNGCCPLGEKNGGHVRRRLKQSRAAIPDVPMWILTRAMRARLCRCQRQLRWAFCASERNGWCWHWETQVFAKGQGEEEQGGGLDTRPLPGLATAPPSSPPPQIGEQVGNPHQRAAPREKVSAGLF